MRHIFSEEKKDVNMLNANEWKTIEEKNCEMERAKNEFVGWINHMG